MHLPNNKSGTPVGVSDIYKLNFRIFQNTLWRCFYILSMLIFAFHACMGWQKAVFFDGTGVALLWEDPGLHQMWPRPGL